MDEDEYNKKSTEKEKNFEDFSIDELVKEINSLSVNFFFAIPDLLVTIKI